MYNSFGDKFVSLANETVLTELQIANFYRSSDPSQMTADEMMKIITSDLENVILTASPRKGMVTFIHSLKNFGGTLRSPDNKVIGLQVEELEALEASNGNTRSRSQFENASFVIVPFHDLKAFIQTDSRIAAELIIASKEANECLLTEEPDSETSEEERIVQGERIRKFLWGVLNGLVEPANLIVDNDDSEAQGHYMHISTKFILPPVQTGAAAPPDVTSDTLKQLSISTAKMSESIDNQNALQTLEFKRRLEAEEKKKNRTKSWIPDHTLNCLKNAGSVDGERQAELSEKLKDFMNAESSGQAGQKLLWDLNQSGYKNTVIAEGVVNSMYYGNFFSINGDEMNAISCFSFSKRTPLQEYQASEYTLLHMSNTIGKAKSAEEIKASLTRTVIVPKNFNEMIASFQRQNSVLAFTFGPNSLLVSRHKQFVSSLNDLEEKVEEMLVSDVDICARIMYKVEIAMNLFLEECTHCEFRGDVDDSLIDFSDIVKSIRSKNLQQRLPKCFKRVNENKRKRGGDDDDKNKDGKPNKQGKQGNQGIFVENKDTIAGCTLHENEDYRKVFLGKEKGDKRPECSFGCKMCPKWLLKGGCWEDCVFKASHVPPSQFSDDEKTAFKGWMDYCRECS
eukprot:scaffold16181_cov47-Cyclotella_meneghiniana.AAC.1